MQPWKSADKANRASFAYSYFVIASLRKHINLIFAKFLQSVLHVSLKLAKVALKNILSRPYNKIIILVDCEIFKNEDTYL